MGYTVYPPEWQFQRGKWSSTIGFWVPILRQTHMCGWLGFLVVEMDHWASFCLPWTGAIGEIPWYPENVQFDEEKNLRTLKNMGFVVTSHFQTNPFEISQCNGSCSSIPVTGELWQCVDRKRWIVTGMDCNCDGKRLILIMASRGETHQTQMFFIILGLVCSLSPCSRYELPAEDTTVTIQPQHSQWFCHSWGFHLISERYDALQLYLDVSDVHSSWFVVNSYGFPPIYKWDNPIFHHISRWDGRAPAVY